MKVEVISVKREHIVEAAIKRFSHFGINKTTFSEIALDLRISKPSLFYYFNDKNSLMEAVGHKIIAELLEGIEAALTIAESTEEGLLKFVELKRDHFKKYFLLAIQADDVEIKKVSPLMTEVITQARDKIQSLISDLLKRGIAQKTLRMVDTSKTSVLLLETLEAFEHCIKSRKKVLVSNDIDMLFDKQKEVADMLLNGLKSSEWKN